MICQNSVHQYSVDGTENHFEKYNYEWKIIESDFKGSIIQNQNKVTVDWKDSEKGDYTLLVTKSSSCGTISQELSIKLMDKINLKLEQIYYLCPDYKSMKISAPSGFDSYKWTNLNGQIISTNQDVNITEEGKYYVQVTSGSCVTRQEIDVLLVKFPTLIVNIDAENSVLIVASGGNTDVMYQLVDLSGMIVKEWQNSNTFFNLKEGKYVVQIKSKNGECLMDINLETMLIPNVITPNSDGKNDAWDLSRLLTQYPSAQIDIFDRFGRKLKTITKEDQFKWDGKLLGKPLQTDSYWFMIKFDDNVRKSGSILIKNK